MELYWITPTLAIATRPRGDDWLASDMEELHQAGIAILVSCLTPEEERELRLTGEARAATEAGVEFVRAATPDRSTPTLVTAEAAARRMVDAQASGRRVAVHCRQGLGRAPLIAAASLVATGMAPDSAWAALAEGRGVPVPETPEQRDWLTSYAAARAAGWAIDDES